MRFVVTRILSMLLLALILVSCGVVPKTYIQVTATREPFEYVAYTSTSEIEDNFMMEIALKTCKGPFLVTQYTKVLGSTIMYFTCKVGR